MAGPLLYKPPPRWQVWAALGGAAFVHLAAAVIAGIHPEEPPVDISGIPEAVVTMEISTEPQPPEPPPPPDEPEPPPPPEVPQEQPEFREENPTPPPKRPPTTAKIQPIKAPRPQGVPTGPVSMSSAKAQAISAPRPEYPYEARRGKITGSGVCVMTVDTASGAVTDATMATSTGSPILDNSAVAAFKRWKFKPGTVSKVRTPITYTLTGASY